MAIVICLERHVPSSRLAAASHGIRRSRALAVGLGGGASESEVAVMYCIRCSRLVVVCASIIPCTVALDQNREETHPNAAKCPAAATRYALETL